MNAQATIGHNRSPYELATEAADLLETEAKNWLDGAEVTTQVEADAIGELIRMARKAKKDADNARKDEAKPFDDGKAEVQARYKPLLSKVELVADACKKALTPFLAAQEAEKRAAEAKAREEAEAAQRAAQEAFQKANAANLEARQEAERLAEVAKQADIAARIAAKDNAKASGNGRAISTRTTIKPHVTDYTELMRWIFKNDRSALVGFCDEYVAGAFRAGQYEMDGVGKVTEATVV